ncbi:extracellular solute-binding protein [Actinacidiphila alni]|uniref:Extracellular solute-binding protein n=1 Tax=Actinacidiphila alni TaxID=380248 RepID=A0A1I2IQY7_9ACTN|nr:substrate-binding domain-containing protein [Actinacidiphila alni]SFF44725.1 extracellular solute-binding protein [Actinacidiphila alni]
MPSPPYDPRGKANRALLIGVYRYAHYDDLPGVRHNLGQLFNTLMGGGMFGAEEIRTVSPATRLDFLSHLETSAGEARGLFLLYFAGHGRLNLYGTELFLAVGEFHRLPGDEPAYAEAVSWNRDVLPKLRDIAGRELVDRVVVILDCCNAGNALEEFKPGALHQGRDRISILTAVQVNQRIPAGSGHEPTPYTKQLIRLLHDGLYDGRPGAGPGVAPGAEDGVGDGVGAEQAAEIRLVPLAAALHDAMRGETTVYGTPWEPRYHAAESEQDVLLAVVPRLLAEAREERERRARRERLARHTTRWRDGWRALARLPRKVLVPLLAALAVLLAGGGYGGYVLASGRTTCAPPVELRLLTDPDEAPTLQKAVDEYLVSGDNHTGDGCRRSGISLVAPKSTDAVTGFQHAADWRTPRSSGDLRPQRDIGAQPDIWIPGSRVTVERARSLLTGHDVTLTESGPVAFTPLVLAVPGELAVAPASATGSGLGTLLAQLKQNNRAAVPVLRADPEYTDSAQLATVGVYGQNTGSTPLGDAAVGQFERQAARLSPAPRSSYELMCELAAADTALKDTSAVLVPEQVMAQFNVHADAKDRLGCDIDRLGKRGPQYPADVAMLDLPFVRVGWEGADRDSGVRQDAVGRFYGWLTGAAGQKVFTEDGYRGRSGDGASGTAVPGAAGASPTAVPTAAASPAVPPADSWLVTDGGALADPKSGRYDTSTGAVTAALSRYRGALGPGKVLYLLDSSSSMETNWTGSGRALDLLSQSLDALGPDDRYGVWTVVGDPPTPTHRLVPLDTHKDVGAVRRAVAGARTVDRESFPGAALTAALSELTGSHTSSGGAQLIVYVTDDEDDNHLKGRALDDLLRTVGADSVPVEWVSLAAGGGCAAGRTGDRIARASGGRCLDASSTQVSELRDDVARVGTGNAG